MKNSIFFLFLFLIIMPMRTSAEVPNGTIAFDCPDLPAPKFQFHFTPELIALTVDNLYIRIYEDKAAVTTTPFDTVDNLYIQIYEDTEDIFGKLVAYYSERLTGENWHGLREDGGTRLYILEETPGQNPHGDNTIRGIFAVVKSDGDVYLLNIVGRTPLEHVAELLANLGELGIEIPELKSLGELSLPKPEETVDPSPLPTLFRVTDTLDSVKGPTAEVTLGSNTKTYQEDHQGHWTYRGHPVERIHIRANERKHVATVSEGLKSGTKDITELLDNLSINNTSVNTPKFIVQPAEKRVTVMAGRMLDETQATMLTKAFRTRSGDPIHEIVIRKGPHTEVNKIRDALERGSDDIETVMEELPHAVPTLERAELLIEERNSRRIATITIVEKPLSSRFFFDAIPRFGFNRVTGSELGARLESGFRAQHAQRSAFRLRSSPESHKDDNAKFLFGQVSYGFADKQPYYQVGGQAAWSKRYSWNLGVRAQFHRATSIIAPDLFSRYDDTGTLVLRILGVPDHQDYYLRQGVEVELEWKVAFRKQQSILRFPNHAFKLILLAESHESLETSTDWHLFNWSSKNDGTVSGISITNTGSESEARENPLITPGQMRSAVFRYDFDTRNGHFGSHYTYLVEHSNPAFGSDFKWTRFQTHLRYARLLGDNQIRVRAVLGSATAPLPIQRQFVMGGIGTLNGYPLYAFAGDEGILFNMEFIYKLYSFGSQSFSAAVTLDQGQVWNKNQRAFNPKASIAIGLQYETDIDVFRFNVAKALEAEQGVQYNVMFFYSF